MNLWSFCTLKAHPKAEPIKKKVKKVKGGRGRKEKENEGREREEGKKGRGTKERKGEGKKKIKKSLKKDV
ncbi:hypothetical protein RhiirC2_60571 [Rhizophagus irregularis]|uniref:Uncharacterized protein n=1 Tax=Rhizophagus irregularis TaxID=588596 RepID=A0A2N1NUJ3_9GLOM|nr:hypothetical protein RhiirC2_60571 [Rhizophagus irregularis]